MTPVGCEAGGCNCVPDGNLEKALRHLRKAVALLEQPLATTRRSMWFRSIGQLSEEGIAHVNSLFDSGKSLIAASRPMQLRKRWASRTALLRYVEGKGEGTRSCSLSPLFPTKAKAVHSSGHVRRVPGRDQRHCSKNACVRAHHFCRDREQQHVGKCVVSASVGASIGSTRALPGGRPQEYALCAMLRAVCRHIS